jgi:hypothetical protein
MAKQLHCSAGERVIHKPRVGFTPAPAVSRLMTAKHAFYGVVLSKLSFERTLIYCPPGIFSCQEKIKTCFKKTQRGSGTFRKTGFIYIWTGLGESDRGTGLPRRGTNPAVIRQPP